MTEYFTPEEKTPDRPKNNSFDARQISAKDASDHFILSLLVKRTYRISDTGKCALNDEQIPLVGEIAFYDGSPTLVSQDSDLYIFKPFTDVVIKGKARNDRKNNSFQASVQIADSNVGIQVVGNRKVFFNQSGKLEFTEAELVEEVPLRYDFAYGGRDEAAEKKIKLPPPHLTKELPPEMDLLGGNPYRYKRNPAGKGYLVEPVKSSIEQLSLPNLEDPENLLTPESLIVHDPSLWYKMPLPRCTDWVSPMWFPRIAYFGLYNLPGQIGNKLAEIARHWAEPKILSIIPMKGNMDFRCTNGASLGLQLPYIKPKERIRMVNIHPKFKDFVLQLPGEYPDLWVDGRKGKLLSTHPFIQTIVIEPDENRVSILWRGSGPAIRPYFDEELKTMPYKVEWQKQ
ncbi:MAG: DUF2169 domain-containing protein [Puia sp.]